MDLGDILKETELANGKCVSFRKGCKPNVGKRHGRLWCLSSVIFLG